jgi:DNA-binding SARP family transcriptional activator/tetratricopeptide (TPR) repeat protein
MRLRLELLYTLSFRYEQQEVALSRSAARLLAYLGLHATGGRSVLRARLADSLAPDLDEAQASRLLSRSLHQLRRAVHQACGEHEPWLHVTKTSVALSNVWVDVEAFTRLLEAGTPEAWAEALPLYRGELLEDFDDEWIAGQRARLRAAYLATLEQLIRALAPEQAEVALPYALRLVAEEPLHEQALASLMQIQSQLGRYDAAFRQYERFRELLEAELGVPPLPETRRLAASIRSEYLARTLAPSRAPLVGRSHDYARLLALLERAQARHGGLSLLLGQAGIGKTRLLEEFVETAQRRGWQVIWGRAEEYALPPPLSPLAQALASALPAPRQAQLKELGVLPYWLDLIARLLFAAPADPALVPTGDLEEAALLPEAVRHVLAGFQHIAPLLLIVDDVQWADPALWPFLDTLREALRALPVLLVLSGRQDALARHDEAAALLQAWQRQGVPCITLHPLDEPALCELAAIHRSVPLTNAQIEQLHLASGGNPLLALSLLQANALDDTSMPVSLTQLLQRRLDTVSAEACQALAVAAVLGYRLDYRCWSEISASPALPQLARELESAGLLMLESDSYRFAHDTLRSYVYEQLSPSERRELHRRALPVLERHTPDDALALLRHAEQAGLQDRVVVYALLSGEQALASLAFLAAARAFSQALASLATVDLAQRFRATRGLVRALDVLAERQRQREALDALQVLADSLDDEGAQAEAAYQFALYCRAIGAFDQAREAAERGLALARATAASTLEAALLLMLGEVARDQAQLLQARYWVEQAQALYRNRRDRFGQALATNLLGSIAYDLGDYPTSAEHHRSAAEAFQRSGDLLREGRALNNLGSALWGCGDYLGARAVHERAVALCHELGDQRGEGDNLDNLGGVAWVLGDYATAIDYYQRALAIRRKTDDRWGISISLSNLGDAHRDRGEAERALDYYAESLAVCREMGRRRGEAFALHGQGLALLALARLDDACETLAEACAIRTELGERDTLIESEAALALSQYLRGDQTQSQRFLSMARERLTERDAPALRQWVAFVVYRTSSGAVALEALQQAKAAMYETAATLPLSLRERFLAMVPLNREVRAALLRLCRRIEVRLVRGDVPLGRRLTEADYIRVEWTLEAPDDAALSHPSTRRRAVLRRLLDEAHAQGAAPTDADLARALEVSVRTIERDMNGMRTDSPMPSTRRRS